MLAILFFLLNLGHNSNQNNMIPDFLISIIVFIGSAIFIGCGIVCFIGSIRFIIELLKGNFPRGRGPFFC